MMYLINDRFIIGDIFTSVIHADISIYRFSKLNNICK